MPLTLLPLQPVPILLPVSLCCLHRGHVVVPLENGTPSSRGLDGATVDSTRPPSQTRAPPNDEAEGEGEDDADGSPPHLDDGGLASGDERDLGGGLGGGGQGGGGGGNSRGGDLGGGGAGGHGAGGGGNWPAGYFDGEMARWADAASRLDGRKRHRKGIRMHLRGRQKPRTATRAATPAKNSERGA